LLEADHKKLKSLFEEFRSAGERAYKTKQGIAEQVFAELQVHTKIEEDIFYPAVRQQGGELEDKIAEGLEEHHVAKVLMEELQALDPEEEQYVAKFTVLMENVEHHVEEEEGELFPESKKELGGAEMEQLGEQMAKRKDQLQAVAER
jgi:hemerythrin-like domain-containing protein